MNYLESFLRNIFIQVSSFAFFRINSINTSVNSINMFKFDIFISILYRRFMLKYIYKFEFH